MGFLSAYSDTTKVSVGDPERGYWIELKDCISQGARAKADKALQGRQRINGNDVLMDMDVPTYRQLMVLASIANWNLDDDSGRVWPIDLAHVQMLPGSEFDRIWAMVDENNKPATSQERRQFPDAGVGGDQSGADGDADTAVAGDVLAGAATVADPGSSTS